MSIKRKHLYISELAQLVGVSVKTIRHYHKLGLLPEPQRSESDYRLYSAEHAQRLQLIRQMRAVGLSLPQIRRVLDAPDSEARLREILQDVLDEIEEQLHELNEKRERIFELLEQDTVRYEDLDDSESLFLEEAKEKLGHLIPDIDDSLIEQEEQLEAILSQFNWSDDMPDYFADIIAYFQAHPEQYQAYIRNMASAWAIIQSDDSDDDTLKQVARELVDKHRDIIEKMQSIQGGFAMEHPQKAMMSEMMGEVVGEKQKRFNKYLYQAMQDNKD